MQWVVVVVVGGWVAAWRRALARLLRGCWASRAEAGTGRASGCLQAARGQAKRLGTRCAKCSASNVGRWGWGWGRQGTI